MPAQRNFVHWLMGTHKPAHFLRGQQGFTVIELMLAVTIMLLISIAALSSFDASLRNSDNAQTVIDTNDNVRSVMNFLTRDFIAAGAEITVGGIPVPTTFLPSRVLYPITPEPGQGPSLDGRPPTDRVRIIYNQMALQGLSSDQDTLYKINGVGAIDRSGQWVKLDTSDPANPTTASLRPGDVLLIKSNGGVAVSALGYVTSLAGADRINLSTGDRLGLNASGATSPVARLGCAAPRCVDRAVAFKVSIVQYYVDDRGPTPVLMRRVNGEPTPLGVNIDDLQFEYVAEFVDADGVLRSTTSKDPANPLVIRKALISLTGRSSAKSYQDHVYYRFPLKSQVTTRNLAYVTRNP